VQISKKRKSTIDKVEKGKLYLLSEAAQLVKQVNTANFDASIDLHIRLGIDPRKADQALRGSVSLPNGSGKTKTVLVFCNSDKEKEAKEAGADFVGLQDMIDKVQGGWTNVDVVIATPDVMGKVAKLGRILGPRNLMPNPKVGTVTNDVANAVTEVKKGKVSFRVDKYGIIHSSIGRVSFSVEQIEQNADALLQILAKMKPSSAKGIYFKSVHMASTMSPGIAIDSKLY